MYFDLRGSVELYLRIVSARCFPEPKIHLWLPWSASMHFMQPVSRNTRGSFVSRSAPFLACLQPYALLPRVLRIIAPGDTTTGNTRCCIRAQSTWLSAILISISDSFNLCMGLTRFIYSSSPIFLFFSFFIFFFHFMYLSPRMDGL